MKRGRFLVTLISKLLLVIGYAAGPGPAKVGPIYSQLISSNSAFLLSPYVEANGLPTSTYFTYYLTNAGQDRFFTPTNLAPADQEFFLLRTIVTNLGPGNYRFEAVVSNSMGGFNRVGSFTIPNTGPAGMAIHLERGWNFRSSQPAKPFFNDDSVTIEFWFKAETGGVLINEIDNAVEPIWDESWLEVRNDGLLVAGLPGLQPLSLRLIQFGQWFHAAIRYDASTKAYSIFLNGEKIGESTGTRLTPWSAGRSAFFAFGRFRPAISPNLLFTGMFDEVRIWRRALSDENIQQRQGLLLTGNDPDLFALWSFEWIVAPPTEQWPNFHEQRKDNRTLDRSLNINPAILINGELRASGANISGSLEPLPNRFMLTTANSVGISRFLIQGGVGTTFRVDRSYDLFSWETLGLFRNDSGTVALDHSTNGEPALFWRATPQP